MWGWIGPQQAVLVFTIGLLVVTGAVGRAARREPRARGVSTSVGATKPARVVAVAEGSAAARAGVVVGDELRAINGEAVRDVIRYQLQADEPVVELEINRGGLEQVCTVEKAAGEPLGLELDAAVFDRVRTCDNHCPFCFIYQLPKGMRKSLYLKDDDYRLSFLYGNFTTLTRFTEADLERVVTERLGPLYVSIHATDPDVRTRLLRNRRGATSLRWLAAILDAGIEVHGQVVVCPGVNDGTVLDDTMLGILDRFPRLATVGVVPLGVSDAQQRARDAPAHAGRGRGRGRLRRAVAGAVRGRARAPARLRGRRVLPPRRAPVPRARRRTTGSRSTRTASGWPARSRPRCHRALAGDATEGTRPKAGFFAWVDGVRPDGYRVPTPTPAPEATPEPVPVALGHKPPTSVPAPVTILTGEYGAAVLAPLLPALEAHARVPVELRPVANRFFGGNIAVTGLLTGADVADALTGVAADRRVLLPDVVLSQGRFLDGTTVDDLPRAVDLVPTDGASLVAALR